ncbi:MAG: MATE family multidrug resistance protein, partial [Flavobacterium sp.]
GLGLFIVSRKLNFLFSLDGLLDVEKLKRMILVNRDIMIRTLCLIFAFAWFTNQGAKFGDITLAANAILMHLVSLSAFFLDGFALAAETLVGAAVGEKNRSKLDQIIKLCTELALITAVSISFVFWLTGSWIISLMSNVELVKLEAEEYLIWAILAPIISVWCYLLDGIFIGATRTTEMRNAMIISLFGFIATWYIGEIILTEAAKNHGLWGALLIYFIFRALALNHYLPRLKNLDGAK